jgi:HPt (histidine-containing phosphotransfer) domain-containing protein
VKPQRRPEQATRRQPASSTPITRPVQRRRLAATETGLVDVDLLNQSTIAQLRETLGVDACQDLHRMFEELLPARLAAIESAARSGDGAELKRTAHLLTGSSAMIGAARLGDVCRELERAAENDDPIFARGRLPHLAQVAGETGRALRDDLA